MASDKRKASDVMTRNPDCVTENDSIHQAAKLMKTNDCGAIPVVEDHNNGKVIGMITDRDIVIRIVADGRDAANAKVSEAMTREAKTVREDQPIDQVYELMSREQVRRVPVISREDKIVGIVAVADVATDDQSSQKLARTVEEISEKSSEHRPSTR